MRQEDETQSLPGRGSTLLHPWRDIFSPLLNQLGCVYVELRESPDPTLSPTICQGNQFID